MPTSRSRALASLSIATLALTTVIGTGGTAVAADRTKQDARVIRACLNPETGKTRIIHKTTRCKRSEVRVTWVRGKRGPQGAKGAPGAAGPAGAAGANGAAGATGATGATGAPGVAGPTGATGATGGIGPAGPTGPVGLTGATGSTGIDGNAGATGPVGPQGEIGPIGPIGVTGPAGATGPTGATGPAGPAGTGGSGTMLSSSTGQMVTTTASLSPSASTVAVLPISGAGSVGNVSVASGTIDATNSAIAGLAQPITGDRTLTGIDGYFTNTTGQTLVGSTLTLTVQLWTSTAPGNVFTPVPGATCTLTPALTGIVGSGFVTSCTTTGLSIPLTNQTQAILVARSDVAGLAQNVTLQGYWSAGLNLS